MRLRHKTPMVFSLAMVDVFCCALGCVILIWQMNSKIADDKVQGTLRQAEQTKLQSDLLLAEALHASKNLDQRYQLILADRDKAEALARLLKEKLAELESDKKGLLQALKRTQLEVLDLTGKLKTSNDKTLALQGDLADLQKRYDAQQLRVVALDKRLVELLAKIKSSEEDLAALQKTNKDDSAKIAELTKALEIKQRDLAALQQLLEEARQARKMLEDSLGKKNADILLAQKNKLDLEKLLRLRQEALDELSRKLEKSEKDKIALRVAAENRFAGIELSGKRVVFLIDISGSMKYLSEDKPAPEKWREVYDTVVRLMRSMNGLEKYQIIVFSDKVRHPLGTPGKWLEFDKTHSPEEVLEALKAIDPQGGTNMYAGLEETFKYREQGLDTIFFLSDGLPNRGKSEPGVDTSKLNDLELGIVLGRFVLKTLKEQWNRPLPGRPQVKIHTIGFFYESPDLGAFLWALSRDNNGSFVGMNRP
ncbi:MAG: VWA domain-containing protein [Gemmataceae bacterium]